MNETGVITDARTLGKPKMFLLGMQHMLAMFGATILVPILVNAYFLEATGEPITRGVTIAVTLCCAGVATLFFHAVTKGQVPAFLGSSFAFLGGFDTVAKLNVGKFAQMGANEKVAYACGGIVIAGLLYLVLAAIIRIVGVGHVMRYLPPVVTGPVIICIGLNLLPSAVANASQNWILALIALGTIVFLMVRGKGLLKIIPILAGVVVAYIAGVIMNACGMTNADGSAILTFAPVADAGWVGWQGFQLAKFDLTPILVMAPIAIAAMMEHVGDISAISATIGKDLISKPGLHRTLFGDGIGTALAGLFCGPANTTYGENTGVLEITKVHDSRVIRIAAIMAIVVSFIPKFSAIIATMPTAIIGGVSFMLYAMISGIGIRNLVENKVDLKKARNQIVLAMILACGLGLQSGLIFNLGSATVTLTPLAIASIVGIVLNAALPGKDYDFGTHPEGDQNRGIHI